MAAEQNNYISQQNEPRNYTSEEKMMIIQLAAALYTPEQIQTLWKEISAINEEFEHLKSVEDRAKSEYDAVEKPSDTYDFERKQIKGTMHAASRKREILQNENDNITKNHHLVVKLKSFEEEVKAPYEPNDGMVDL